MLFKSRYRCFGTTQICYCIYLYIGAQSVNMFFHLIAFLILAFFLFEKKEKNTLKHRNGKK